MSVPEWCVSVQLYASHLISHLTPHGPTNATPLWRCPSELHTNHNFLRLFVSNQTVTTYRWRWLCQHVKWLKVDGTQYTTSTSCIGKCLHGCKSCVHIIVCKCASWCMNNTTCASEVFVHMQHMHLCMLNLYMSYCIHMHSSYWWYRPCVSVPVPLCHSLQNNNRLRRMSCAQKLIKHDYSYANCLFAAVSCAEVPSVTEKKY